MVVILANWDASRNDPLKYRSLIGLERLQNPESVMDKYKSCRNPLSICKDVFVVRPCLAEIRRASSTDLRRGVLRVRKHLQPAGSPFHEDTLGRGGEVAASQTCGAGLHAEEVAMESLDRIRLNRVPAHEV